MNCEKEEKASRERYWSEIDDKEKIRRLRQQVKELQHSMQIMRDKVDILINHQHGNDNKLLVKYEDSLSYVARYGRISGNPRNFNDDVYF